MPRHVTIEQIEEQAKAAIERCQQLVVGLSDQQLQWRPDVKSWSIAECIQHLNVSLGAYQRVMRVSFERERQNAPLAPASFRVGFVAAQFASFLEPPYRMRAKAKKELSPQPGLDPAKVIGEYVRSREDLLRFAHEACRIDMSSIRFPSPIAPVLKFSLTEAFLVMLAHDRRHLWQAENVKAHPDFPAA
jgi:hypothetical protein